MPEKPALPFAVSHGPVPRFTPDEIKELANELTPDDIAKMHPADQRVAQAILSPQNSGDFLMRGDTYGADAIGSLPSGKDMAESAGAAAAIGSLPMLGPAAGAIRSLAAAHPVGASGAGIMGLELAKTMGLPAGLASTLETLLGWRAILKSGGKGLASEAEAEVNPTSFNGKPIGERIMPTLGPKATDRPYMFPPKNVEKVSRRAFDQVGGSKDMNTVSEISGGVKVNPRDVIADEDGFQRALEAELKRIQTLKTGSKDAKYNSYIASEEAKAPQTMDINELLNRLRASLGK